MDSIDHTGLELHAKIYDKQDKVRCVLRNHYSEIFVLWLFDIFCCSLQWKCPGDPD